MIVSGTALALFDFDGTLARGDSVLPYLLYCIRKGVAPRTQLLRAACGYIRFLIRPSAASGAKAQTLSFIRRKTVEEMDALARDFFQEEYIRRFFQEGLQELWRLREEGYRILVVSASADVYMRVLPEFLPVDAVLATTCEVDAGGRYTGGVGVNCKGEEKPRRIAAWLDAQGLTLDVEASCAYGDSPSDAPMLLMTAAPGLINPKKKLLRRLPQARVLRWHTEDKA
ncbi:MAG: HAD family hydrolase [Aristaeellaceae bacterium]